MLYTKNPNFVESTPIEFYEPIDEPVTLIVNTKSTKFVQLYDNDVEQLLILLRKRMARILDPLYLFIGMLAAGLGETNDKMFYKPNWKMPVRAYKKEMTIEKFFEFHSHIPKDVMTDVVFTHYIHNKKKNVTFDTGEHSSEVSSIGPPINYNYADMSFLSFSEGSPVRDIYNLVLSFSTSGGLEMATSDINLAAKKDFTTRELIESTQVRHMYAQYVSSKFATARAHDKPQSVGRRYQRIFISPSYTQISAQSKWTMGAKIWFQTVYRRTTVDESLTQQINKLIVTLSDKDDTLDNNIAIIEDYHETPEYAREIMEHNIVYENLWKLKERARPQLYKSNNRKYIL